MPLEKQSLNNFLPNGFETLNQEGYKENFSEDKIATGYEKDVPDIVSGPNLNNLIDVVGKNTNTLNNYVEYLNGMPINNVPTVNTNGQLDYMNLDDKLTKKQITNCILEIPQRIKLELNNGVLTLKAGSEVIIPDGFEDDGVTPKFNYVTVSNNLTFSNLGTNGDFVLVATSSGTYWKLLSQCASGSSDPQKAGSFYYDVSKNLLKDYTNSGASYNVGLPIAIVNHVDGLIKEVKQVFNGMGYIGSTLWVDKGVKGLAPNGRNEDGTLNNTIIDYKKLYTRTFTSGSSAPIWFAIQFSGISDISTSNYKYNEKENRVQKISTGEFMSSTILAGSYVRASDGSITSFKPIDIPINIANNSQIDGSWVSKNIQLAKDVTYPKTTSIEYDLSEYLPNDNYNYMVMFQGNVSSTSSTGKCSLQLLSQSISTTNICSVYGANDLGSGTIQLPIGTDNKITVNANSEYVGMFSLIARGYRRLGNNS